MEWVTRILDIIKERISWNIDLKKIFRMEPGHEKEKEKTKQNRKKGQETEERVIYPITLNGAPRNRRENGTKKNIFEEIILEKFPTLLKDIK